MVNLKFHVYSLILITILILQPVIVYASPTPGGEMIILSPFIFLTLFLLSFFLIKICSLFISLNKYIISLVTGLIYSFAVISFIVKNYSFVENLLEFIPSLIIISILIIVLTRHFGIYKPSQLIIPSLISSFTVILLTAAYFMLTTLPIVANDNCSILIEGSDNKNNCLAKSLTKDIVQSKKFNECQFIKYNGLPHDASIRYCQYSLAELDETGESCLYGITYGYDFNETHYIQAGGDGGTYIPDQGITKSARCLAKTNHPELCSELHGRMLDEACLYLVDKYKEEIP